MVNQRELKFCRYLSLNLNIKFNASVGMNLHEKCLNPQFFTIFTQKNLIRSRMVNFFQHHFKFFIFIFANKNKRNGSMALSQQLMIYYR